MSGDDHQHLAAMSPCAYCQNLFVFDPDTVRSIYIDHDTWLPAEPMPGNDRIWREPLCDQCVPLIERAAAGSGTLSWPNQRRTREN